MAPGRARLCRTSTQRLPTRLPQRVSESALDLARLEAAGADVGALGDTLDEDAHALQVRFEAALGRHHRVAPVVAEAGLATAQRADFGHRGFLVSDRAGARLTAAN